jgi:hypothetical protein
MRFFYFLLALFTLYTQHLSAQACHPQDSLELIELYQAADGANWSKKWDLSKPVKYNWPGVGVNDDGRVTGLNLQGNLLSGTLPNLNLPEVKWIDLTFNYLSGSIPALDSMPNLEILLLFSNKFSGSIPSFDHLSKIQEIDFSENQLSGDLPDFALPTLEKLNLSYNEFSGGVPTCDCPNLTRFLLEKNELTGEIPNLNHPKLGWVSFSLNHFTGNIPDFDLPELTILAASDNELSGSLPDFSKLPKLKNMVLQANQFTGSIPNFQLSDLRWIFLSNNKLEGDIPAFDLPEVTALHLGHNQLTGNIPNFQLPKLHSLEVSSNQLSGKVPDIGEPLNFLYLDNNRFTFDGLEEFKLKDSLWIFAFNPQAPIPMLVSGNVLSVNAGGTLANNTYFWYKDSVLVAEKTGDSTFVADQPGTYYCKIVNSVLVLPSGFQFSLFSEPYSHTVAADEVVEKWGFEVFPNPISDNQPLQISLENDFFGTVKFEILSPDGQLISVFEKEKTAEKQVFELENLPAGNSFFVKISDEKRSATRQIFKF